MTSCSKSYHRNLFSCGPEQMSRRFECRDSRSDHRRPAYSCSRSNGYTKKLKRFVENYLPMQCLSYRFVPGYSRNRARLNCHLLSEKIWLTCCLSWRVVPDSSTIRGQSGCGLMPMRFAK